jgi:hypothetical protein
MRRLSALGCKAALLAQGSRQCAEHQQTVPYGLIRGNRIRSIKDGKYGSITSEALYKHVRTSERDYEEAIQMPANRPGQRGSR